MDVLFFWHHLLNSGTSGLGSPGVSYKGIVGSQDRKLSLVDSSLVDWQIGGGQGPVSVSESLAFVVAVMARGTMGLHL